MSSHITERQLEAFRSELRKEGSKWYGNAAKAVGNFAKRQAHSVTGWTPHGYMNPKGIEEIGAGVAPARQHLEHALKSGKAVPLAREAVKANQDAQDLGLTSLPGYAKALWNKDTRGKVLPTAMNQQLRGANTLERAVTLGLPATDLALEAATPDDPDNPQKGKHLGRAIAGTAAGIATGSLPFMGGLIAGAAAGRLGGMAGGAIDKLRARKKAPPQDFHVQAPPNPEESRGQSGPPVERNMSPAAMGQAPDWSGS
jgi:hypothetical protein